MLPSRIASVLLVIGFAQPSWSAEPQPYRQQQNVVFAEVHGTGLLMDIFTPTGNANGRAIVDVVSGAWYSDRGKIRDHELAQMYSTFCARGYVVFAARPGSRTRYTAGEMADHIHQAVRYVKGRAEEFQIAPDQLGLTGASAGGHLATLAALTATPASGNGNGSQANPGHDATVRAVGVFFPPTDFLDWKDGGMLDRQILGPLLFVDGGQQRTDEELRSAAKAVSPFHQVSRPTNPYLLIHGDADAIVPLAQSEKLVDAINQAGGTAKLIVKPGGGHPWPTIAEEVRVLADWFDQQLSPVAGSEER